MRASTLVLLAFATASLPAQTTWIVDQSNGPGTNFTTIQAAVKAAAPGDTILVRPTPTRGGYAGAKIEKGVFVLGLGNVELDSNLLIVGIPSDQHVAVASFTMRDAAAGYTSYPNAVAIVCQSCDGTVELQNVTGAGSRFGPGLTVTDCAHVAATDCTLDAGTSIFMFGLGSPIRYSTPLEGIRCRHSEVALTRVQGKGLKVYDINSNVYATVAAVTADDSRLVAVGCTLTGGDGFENLIPPLGPTAALTLTSSSHLVTKGTTYTGGLPALPTTPQAPGIQADAHSQIVSDPQTTFTLAGGQLTQQPIADLQAHGAPPGASLALTLSTSTPASYVTFGSFPGLTKFAPLDIWLDLSMALPLFMGSVNGSHTDTIPVPTFFPDGLPAVFQSILLRPGTAELSTPAIVVLH